MAFRRMITECREFVPFVTAFYGLGQNFKDNHGICDDIGHDKHRKRE